jgi:hypothetical protein
MAAAMTTVERAGHRVENACPALPGLAQTYQTLRAMFWAALPGRAPAEVQAFHKPTLVQNIEQGRSLSAETIYDAQLTGSKLSDAMRVFLQTHDVLAFPEMGVPAGPVEHKFRPRSTATRAPTMSNGCGFPTWPSSLACPPCPCHAVSRPTGYRWAFNRSPRPPARRGAAFCRRASDRAGLGGPLGPIDPIRP